MAIETFEAPLDMDAEYEVQTNDVPVKDAASAAEFDIEVVDDTPAEDRNRKPLPDEVVKELEGDNEVEEYSDKVKQRINQLKKAWHDERRAKEAALREREEAARVAQMAYQERQAYLERLQQGEMWAIEQAKQRAQLQVEHAKIAYRSAYESGDTDRILEAQQALNSTMMEYDRFSQYQPQYQNAALQQSQQQVYSQHSVEPQAPSVPEPDSRTMEWGQKNAWFGNDKKMTAYALGVHDSLVNEEGISPNSDEYFKRIDAEMRERFPEKFGVKRQSSTVVAPVGRTPKGKKVVLTQTQLSLAKRLGLTPGQYAKELVKMEK